MGTNTEAIVRLTKKNEGKKIWETDEYGKTVPFLK